MLLSPTRYSIPALGHRPAFSFHAFFRRPGTQSVPFPRSGGQRCQPALPALLVGTTRAAAPCLVLPLAASSPSHHSPSRPTPEPQARSCSRRWSSDPAPASVGRPLTASVGLKARGTANRLRSPRASVVVAGVASQAAPHRPLVAPDIIARCWLTGPQSRQQSLPGAGSRAVSDGRASRQYLVQTVTHAPSVAPAVSTRCWLKGRYSRQSSVPGAGSRAVNCDLYPALWRG